MNQPRQMITPKPEFTFGMHCELGIPDYRGAVLSIPAIDQGLTLRSKDLLTCDTAPSDGKYTLDEHLGFLLTKDVIRDNEPLLVLGMRNSVVNWRAPVIRAGRAYSAEPETPADSRRAYFGLGARNGKLVFEQALGNHGITSDWPEYYCAGIPVLWDDLSDEKLLDTILTEAADHSHVFDIPRGKHPLATPERRAIFERLNRVFRDHLASEHAEAASAMHALIDTIEPPLKRCDDYFHAIIGGRPDGSLHCLFAQGRLETLGETLARRGCHRAICVENSGSVMPTFLPNGPRGDSIPLVRPPNFRPAGRALLVLRLESSAFEAAPLLLT